MLSSFLVSLVLLILVNNGVTISTHVGLVATVVVTTVCWLITAFVAPPTDRRVLIDFYRLVRPAGPGWNSIRAEANLSPEEAKVKSDNIPMALLGWVAGCTMIWSSLFTVGNFLYGRNSLGFTLLAVFVTSALILIYVVQQLWADRPERTA